MLEKLNLTILKYNIKPYNIVYVILDNMFFIDHQENMRDICLMLAKYNRLLHRLSIIKWTFDTNAILAGFPIEYRGIDE